MEDEKDKLEDIKDFFNQSSQADQDLSFKLLMTFVLLSNGFLLNKYQEENGPEDIKMLMKAWNNEVEKKFGDELKKIDNVSSNPIGKLFQSVGGLPSTSETHQKWDSLLYNTESLIKLMLNMDKEENG